MPSLRNIYGTVSALEEMGDHMARTGAFWDDLAEDLKDPELLREYIAESVRIATIDAIVNAIDDAREAARLSKAELARAINAEPATVRRLLSSSSRNPTLGTLAELAAALGMEVTLRPRRDLSMVTDSLLAGRAADPRQLAEHLGEMRASARHEDDLVSC